MKNELIKDLKDNYWEKGVDYFCKKYNKTRSAIHSIAYKNKFTAPNHFNTIKNDILNEYKGGVSIKSILLKYGHAESTIRKFLINSGIKIRDKRESHLEYHLDESIFEKIDSYDKAYWLGFLYADGNIYQNKLQLRLGKQDLSHLKKFKRFLKSNHKIYKDGSCYGLQIRSPKIISDLKPLGVFPNKTLLVKYPTFKQVPKRYQSSFILGYFDGDGSISMRSNRSTYTINMIGTKNLLKGIENILLKNCPNLLINIKAESRGKKAHVLYCSGGIKKYALSRKRFCELYSFLFTNAPKCALMRKRKKFDIIYNYARTFTEI